MSCKICWIDCWIEFVCYEQTVSWDLSQSVFAFTLYHHICLCPYVLNPPLHNTRPIGVCTVLYPASPKIYACSATRGNHNRNWGGCESATCHRLKIYAIQATWVVLSVCSTVTYESKSQRRKKARVFETGGRTSLSKVLTAAAQIISHPPASAPSAARGAGPTNHTTSY